MIKNFIYFFLLLGFSFQLEAQQYLQYTDFLFHPHTYNPAFTGINQNTTFFISNKRQWIGIEGEPNTKLFSYSTPTKLRGLGFGVVVINDQFGPISQSIYDLDFSYTISTSIDSYIAFGIKGGMNILGENRNLLNPDNELGVDPLLANNIDDQIYLTTGAGILYYTNTFFISISAPSIIDVQYFDKLYGSNKINNFNVYINSAFVQEINNNLKLRYNFMIINENGSPIKASIGTSLLIAKKVSIMTSLRINKKIMGLIGYQFSKHLFVGLEYTKPPEDFKSNLSGYPTLGVFLQYIFIKKDSKSRPSFMF